MTDPAFEIWLKRQHELGHDRDWMRRNMVAVGKAFRDSPLADLAHPQRLLAEPVGDRYDGL